MYLCGSITQSCRPNARLIVSVLAHSLKHVTHSNVKFMMHICHVHTHLNIEQADTSVRIVSIFGHSNLAYYVKYNNVYK